MAEIVQMPKMSDTMEEGTIAVWHKKVGDTVESGELMAEIETDKATMEYESYNDGTVLYLGAEEGGSVPVNGVLAIVGEKGEDYSVLLSSSGGGDSAPKSEEQTTSSAVEKVDSDEVDVSGINAEIVRMPKMSDTMEEGTIAAWHKKVGDVVESGELMAEVETDKATMEYESYNDGTVLYLGAEEGGAVVVNGVLAVIGEAGADFEALLKAEQSGGSVAVKATEQPDKIEEPKSIVEDKKVEPIQVGATEISSDDRVKASPLAKRLAKESGFNISEIKGTGPNGRVVKADVEGYTPAVAPAKTSKASVVPQLGVESYEDVAATTMRKAITKSLNASQFGAPHFYLTMDIDMDKAIEARKGLNEYSPVKISFNDLVMKAVASSLRAHPDVNTSWISETNSIRKYSHVNIGVAMAIPDGLVVPVVRFADGKSLATISAEVKELAGKAKSKKLGLDEMQGNTFTVSNLGMFGIEQFTSIINAPESCILAVGGIKQVPVVKNGEIVPGNVMKVTLTCDHRTVDGAVGAAFLATLKQLLEDPIRLLI
jgi:pyruvate dehydrogenase E2 component (dihydrolipoamide acetyltransferase)